MSLSFGATARTIDSHRVLHLRSVSIVVRSIALQIDGRIRLGSLCRGLSTIYKLIATFLGALLSDVLGLAKLEMRIYDEGRG